MGEQDHGEVTRLLEEWTRGDRDALNRLMPLVYGELRRMSSYYLRGERENHTLQSAALVHEAYLRLVGRQNVHWKNRAHFLGVAAQVIRSILVDHARARSAAKRGAGAVTLTVSELSAVTTQPEVDVIELDTALNELARLDPQQSRIVELRFFAGLTNEETAEVLGVSASTVKRDWTHARAWIYRALTGDTAPPGNAL
jgi:RNA polymerase sigma factor (TIGR02999 family)